MNKKKVFRVTMLLCAALLLTALCGCGSGDTAGTPDFYVVFGCTEIPSSQAQEALSEKLESIVGDVNGDGESIVTVEYIGISNDSNSVTDSGRLTVLLSEEQYTLYLLSDEPNEDFAGISSNFVSQEYFDDLSEYGITPDGDQSARVTISGCPILEEMGLGEIDFYAHIIDRGNSTDTDSAIKVIQALLG